MGIFRDRAGWLDAPSASQRVGEIGQYLSDLAF